MRSKTLRKNKGFGAFVAVMLIASGVLAVSLSSISSALSYEDGVDRREYRIQARLNVEACLDAATLMIAKDYFLNGVVTLSEFGCDLFVSNDLSGNVSLKAVTVFLGITERADRKVKINDNGDATIL